jgi:DHA1 family bicyclomycin/chloramphenicol resistance-like MFS transporter
VQLTLTATTLGFALGQLLVGPWTDRVGRRLPLIVATSVHVVASLGVVLSSSIEWLFVFRVLQGVGAAAGGVVAMAIVRDLFGGQPLVRMLSRLALVNGLAPILAPVIGSQLLLLVPWRGIFVFLTIYGGLVLLAAVFFIVETLPQARRADPGHSTARQRYRSLFTDRVFVGVALIAGLTFSGMFAYLSSSPFLFQQVYGLDAQQFGLLFAVNSVGVVAGVQASSFLMRFVGPQWILVGSLSMLVISATTIVALDVAGVGLGGILIALWFFILSCGFTFPCAQVLALANHGSEAGTAASLLGALNFGLAGLISPIVGLFGITSAIPMGAIMGCTALISILLLWTVVRPWSVPALTR